MRKRIIHHDTTKTWHQQHRDERTRSERLADFITDFVGSWTFIILHTVWFGWWILAEVEPFPYGLLTMIVSLEAILLSTFIMISQNRETERDRIQAQADYETNIAAKKEIEDLQRALARIEAEKLDEILKVLERK